MMHIDYIRSDSNSAISVRFARESSSSGAELLLRIDESRLILTSTLLPDHQLPPEASKSG